MTSHETLHKACELLRTGEVRSWDTASTPPGILDASFEFPGVIHIPLSHATALVVGDVNGYFGADLVRASDGDCIRPIDDFAMPESTPPMLLACCVYAVCGDLVRVRKLREDQINQWTVRVKCTMEEFAQTIREQTGRTVDPEAQDMLETLTNVEVENLHEATWLASEARQ